MNHWSLFCASANFDQTEADQVCSRLGMSYATNFTTIPISRLLNGSTWAMLSPLINDSTNINDIDMNLIRLAPGSNLFKFGPTCESGLALMIECANLYCHTVHNATPHNGTLETPDEMPTSVFITNSTDPKVSTKCQAYTLSPKWLLTSGQCVT